MGSAEGSSRISVFDGVKIISSMSKALMAEEMNTVIANLECAHATAHLDFPSSSLLSNVSSDAKVTPHMMQKWQTRLIRQDVQNCCWQVDEALHSLNLSKFTPDTTSAVAKLQSVISPTSQQLHKSPN